jgi:predicted dehydrogenase
MKIGIFGLGSIGSRHAGNLMRMGHEVIGFDPVVRVAGIHNCLTMDYLCSAADAIIIASPTVYHYYHLVEAVNSGKPFLVEKPVADVDDVFRWDDAKGIVGYNLRFLPAVGWAKYWLDHLIGKPLWANFTCAQLSTKPAYMRDGVVLNWSHEIDLALHLLGPAKVNGSSIHMDTGTMSEDVADILLTHDNGCHTVIHLDYVTTPEKRDFLIYGERGSVHVNLRAQYPDYMCKVHNENGRLIEGHVSREPFDSCYVTEMIDFVAFAGGMPTGGATWKDGLRALAICLEVKGQQR